jgi:hypothetical protein
MWGGALFGDDWRTLRFNFLSLGEPALRPTGQDLPRALVTTRMEHLVDEMALVSRRLERDGWTTRSEGTRIRSPRGSPLQCRFDPPAIREKIIGAGELKLCVQLHGTNEANGRPYVETGQIQDKDDRVVVDLGRIDWADVDHTGDVLYAANGCIHRLRTEWVAASTGDMTPMLIADLNALTFEEVVAPEWAQRWP